MGTSHISKIRKKLTKTAPAQAVVISRYAFWLFLLFSALLGLGLGLWALGISVPSWGYGRPDAYWGG